ncbi:hypothetical protein [Blattabacterium clevelandi]|uniref:hypothetical protein n=1 Tax=Blattabacterium clevelandi TaxID=164516 RepID=UPI001374E9FC|nr:hypothetical protein [Blattabacterium clevelandi]
MKKAFSSVKNLRINDACKEKTNFSEVMMIQGKYFLIRRRETMQDLIRKIVDIKI